MDGLSCLHELAAANRPVGTRELARLMGLHVTRVNRLLKGFAHLGFARLGFARQTLDRKYLPGPGMHVLTALSVAGDPLIIRGVPLLERLRATLEPRLALALGVLWHRHVAYLYFEGPTRPRQGHLAVRSTFTFPALRSSIGRASLAYEPPSLLSQHFPCPGGLAPFTDREQLDTAFASVRCLGQAHVNAEESGYSPSLAVALGTPKPYVAIAIIGDTVLQRSEHYLPRLSVLATELHSGIDAMPVVPALERRG